MQSFTTVKMFGTGQVTIPKKYRPKGVYNFIVRKEDEKIILTPLEIMSEADLKKEDELGWETVLDLREEGGISADRFLKILRKINKSEQNRKVSKVSSKKRT